MGSVVVRELAPDDVHYLVGYAGAEGWSSDGLLYANYLEWSPRGCFVVEVDGGVEGGVTTISYGRTGWIGNLLVAPHLRGRGLGGALLRRAVRHLEGAGARGVYLDSVPGALSLYEREGFRRKAVLIKFAWKGDGATRADAGRPGVLPGAGRADVREGGPADLGAIARLDASAWGVDRSRVLSTFLGQKRTLMTSDAYLMYFQPKSCGSACVGPWIAAGAGGGRVEALLATLLRETAAVGATLETPAENARACDMLLSSGFREVRRNTLMLLGGDGGEDLTRVFCVSGGGDLG